jgi:hypothetical protein
MPNSQFYTALSDARYFRYLSASGNRRKALKLYRANISLSKEMYAIIGVFEVILRNSIDRHMSSQKGSIWLEEAVDVGGYLHTSVGCEDSFHSVQEAIHTLGIQYTHDRLIAKLTLGFWRYQFAAKEYAASGSTLLNIFVNRPFGTKQKDVLKKLIKINEVRNRIAHYEPLCFDGSLISTARIERRYSTVLELLEWLGCNPKRILYGIDGVPKSIEAIKSFNFDPAQL